MKVYLLSRTYTNYKLETKSRRNNTLPILNKVNKLYFLGTFFCALSANKQNLPMVYSADPVCHLVFIAIVLSLYPIQSAVRTICITALTT